MNDRFNLLRRRRRTALPRQQTLRATLDWSWDQLPEDVRVLFRRLPICAGGFTLDAVEDICSDAPFIPQRVFDLFGRLVDRSLVKVERSRQHERYSMLETIREYGWEKLAASEEEQELHRRNAGYFTHIAEEMEPKIKGPEQTLWLDHLDADLDNFRADWEFAWIETRSWR